MKFWAKTRRGLKTSKNLVLLDENAYIEEYAKEAEMTHLKAVRRHQDSYLAIVAVL